MNDQRLTIGRLADAAGVTRKAVRTYEAKGLLPKPERTDAGYRAYDAGAVELLVFIRRARTLGLRLDDIRRIVAARAQGTRPCRLVCELIEDRIEELDRAVDDMIALRETLTETRSRAHHRSVRDDSGVDSAFCSIIETQGNQPNVPNHAVTT